jgi:glycosyltransferase involved in cell wall biosynthesis
MRLGFDMGPITSNRTGVGNFCYSLLKALLDLEDAPEVHGLAAGLSHPRLGALTARASCRRLPIPTRAMYKIWNTFGLPTVESLIGPVEVFHATNYYLPPVKYAGRVLSIYDLAFLVNPEWCSPRIVGPFTKQIRRFAQEAALILAASEATKRDISNLLGVPEDKIRVTYGAPDSALEPVPREQAAATLASRYGIRSPYLLFVSTIEPRKNVLGLLDAFRSLARRCEHQLVLVGSRGWNAESTLAALHNPDIADRVNLLGFVPFDDLAALYSAADALVFPSHYEGFGLPVLEAMACGCPVITSNTSSLPEVGGDAAIYCDPNDTGALSNAIECVLGDPDRRSRMIATGHDQARRFSWRSCAETTLAAYREVAP